jgi:hypothetical protein
VDSTHRRKARNAWGSARLPGRDKKQYYLVDILSIIRYNRYKQAGKQACHKQTNTEELKMALGFTNVEHGITTRLIYNLTPDQVTQYDEFIEINKVKALYQRFAILNIMSFNGYAYECKCKRTHNAFKKLKAKGLIQVIDGYAHLVA